MSDDNKWEGRSRGTTLGYKIFIWLLKVGGLGATYKLLYFVTLYYRWFAPDAISPLRHLYAKRLGYDKKQTDKLVRKNLITFGQTIIDKIAVLSGVKNKLTFAHDGVENIEQMVAAGKGGILLSAHLGNWETAGHLLKRVNSVINIVMYDGEADSIKQYMEQYNEQRSFNIILIKDDLSHIYEMSAALNRNELVCLHGDRFRAGNRTIRKEFLGKEAEFPAGPFILASKLKAPVCFVFAFKETNFHYHFYAYPPAVYDGKGMTGANKMLDDYVGLLETKIKEYPSQWFNYYDFWNDDES
ncbi:MAG: lipid A biosynthesis acyltransferase [Chitinophagales bacterium]|nr:lipid A biosynthesis acyltransferase [Chitinophagaceae bacterium]MCB9064860.1 lipid A biosynthesis acyltransferase [Chitinophagales bacterium]